MQRAAYKVQQLKIPLALGSCWGAKMVWWGRRPSTGFPGGWFSTPLAPILLGCILIDLLALNSAVRQLHYTPCCVGSRGGKKKQCHTSGYADFIYIYSIYTCIYQPVICSVLHLLSFFLFSSDSPILILSLSVSSLYYILRLYSVYPYRYISVVGSPATFLFSLYIFPSSIATWFWS